jgi:hypothetical protein
VPVFKPAGAVVFNFDENAYFGSVGLEHILRSVRAHS